jgi:hypothetical protein
MRILSGIYEVFNWLTPLDLELRILGSAEAQSPGSLDKGCGNEPPSTVANEDEQVVHSTCIEPLCRSLPALVAAVGRNADCPTLAVIGGDQPVGGGLDLDTK